MKAIRKLLIFSVIILTFLAADRILFMPGRLLHKGWEFQSGDYSRDPIVFGQHCELRGNTVYFTTHEKQILICSYFNQLFLYNPENGIVSRYTEYYPSR